MATSGSSTRRRVPACIGQLLRGQLLEAPYEGCVQCSERRRCLCRGSVMRNAQAFQEKSPQTPPARTTCRQDKSSQDLRVGFYAKITRLDTRLRHKHIQCVSAHTWPRATTIGGPCQRVPPRVTYPPLESGPSCYYHSSNSLICWPVTDNKYSTCPRTERAVGILPHLTSHRGSPLPEHAHDACSPGKRCS